MCITFRTFTFAAMDIDGERTTIWVVDYIGTQEEQALYGQLAVWAIEGARNGMHEDADLVFEAWHQTVQEHDKWKSEQHFLIAKARGGQPEWGIARMNALLAVNPDDEIAKIGVGLAMLLGGLPNWRENIDYILATSMDQYARKVALRTITFVASNLLRYKVPLGNLRPA